MPVGQAPLDKYICVAWVAFDNPTLTQITHNPNFHITLFVGLADRNLNYLAMLEFGNKSN